MPIKILVVDDELDVEILVTQHFRKKIREKTYEFSFAHDGFEALNRVQSDPEIELILTDINMPGMDGLTLLGRLAETKPEAQQIVVSAYSDMKNIRVAMNRGAFDFLTKPIDFQDFETTISNALTHLQLLKESARSRSELAAVQREMNIAHVIQQSILPQRPLPFEGVQPIELASAMLPARSVGGDLYDYFLIDPHHVGLVIGDVSGKGVPAALFMAMCRVVLKTIAMTGAEPGECLRRMNGWFCRDHDSEMFVTIFYGVLDLQTGELAYSNGGHNPPYVLSGNAPPMPVESPRDGTVLGIIEDAQFETVRVTLHPQDVLFLYTDGVTEAMNAEKEQFTPARLSAVLGENRSLPPAGLLTAVATAVQEFVAGAPQSDDFTALGVRYLGSV